MKLNLFIKKVYKVKVNGYICIIQFQRKENILVYIYKFFEYSRINDYICDIGRWLKKRFIF